MKIREILNLMEEIEKKHSEKSKAKTYGAANASGDDELDDPVGDLKPMDRGEPRDGQKNAPSGSQHGSHHHHKHHQHHDTRAQQLDKEFANIDIDEPEDKGDGNDEFKKMAGSLGDDLYVVSLYDWNKVIDNDFITFRPNSEMMSMLKDIDDPVVKSFVSDTGQLDSDDKTISALFLNDRNGQFFTYRAGANGSEFSPDDVDVIDGDQSAALDRIQKAGDRYISMLGKITWKAGQQAPSDRVYDISKSLVDALKLPNMPEEWKPPKLTGDDLKSHREIAKAMAHDMDPVRRRERLLKRMADREAEMAGVGRDKR